MAPKKFTLFLAAGTVLVTGCSSLGSTAQPDGTASPQPEPSVRAVPKVPTDRLQVTRPLDKYTPDTADDTALKKAEAVVVNRCLRDLGHRQHPLDENAVAEAEPNIYEFLWFPEAAKNGYSLPPEGPEKGSWDDTATQTEKKLLSGKMVTYKGHQVPKDGCYGEAGRELTEGASPPSKFEEQGMVITRVSDASPRGLIESYVSVIRQTLSLQIQQDSRIKRVISRWSSCMKSDGYKYTSPTEAATDARWQTNTGKGPGKAETATAAADMACKKRVRYLDVVVAVESAYEQRYISRHAEQMKEFLDLRAKWRKNAERITGA
ncbi:hypothetical protein [Streptomyces caeruleatus]|uniref:Secreted protein n=1 Tax=Streptomyces caeruleatus TaxID=661399 RepID=A0A101TV29_9ACTN|nr:hypothetical protein [Streptomyces caeruleatus]KUN99124.1 hypothetical protein AQJ67_26190 [Streptomyces caeruleatus]